MKRAWSIVCSFRQRPWSLNVVNSPFIRSVVPFPVRRRRVVYQLPVVSTTTCRIMVGWRCGSERWQSDYQKFTWPWLLPVHVLLSQVPYWRCRQSWEMSASGWLTMLFILTAYCARSGRCLRWSWRYPRSSCMAARLVIAPAQIRSAGRGLRPILRNSRRPASCSTVLTWLRLCILYSELFLTLPTWRRWSLALN